jgi:transcriptional regulator
MSGDRRRPNLIQGRLDLLILRTLLHGPIHGHGIARHIQRTSDDVLQVEHGSLYPALHRLEKAGCIASRWEQTDRGREMRFYRLTVDEAEWRRLTRAMARMLRPI